MLVREAAVEYSDKMVRDRDLVSRLLPTRMKDRDAIIDKILAAKDGNELKNLDLPDNVSKILASAIEFGKRFVSIEEAQIRTPEDAYNRIRRYGYEDKEHFIVLSLNGMYQLIDTKVVSIGTTNMTIANPVDVLSDIVKNHVSTIILAHNHPSGVLMSTREDMLVTKRLKACCELFGVRLLDHIIFSEHKFMSMKAKDLIDFDKKEEPISF